jgi:hypothetical protein
MNAHESLPGSTGRVVYESILAADATTLELKLPSLLNETAMQLLIGLHWNAAANGLLILNGGSSIPTNVRVVSGYAGGPSTAESLSPSGYIAGASALNDCTFTSIDLAAINGRLLGIGQTVRTYSTGHLWNLSFFTAVASITSIGVQSSVATAIKAGSFIRLVR